MIVRISWLPFMYIIVHSCGVDPPDPIICTEIISSTLRRVSKGTSPPSEEDSIAAVMVAKELAIQHPMLVIPHIPALIRKLQSAATGVNEAKPESRAAMMRTITRVIGLLDAVRPNLLQQCNARPSSGDDGAHQVRPRLTSPQLLCPTSPFCITQQ